MPTELETWHTFPMSRVPSPSRTVLLWVIALALVGVRMSDAHVHLCFDGQEPRASLHIWDDPATCHTTNDRGRDHQDQDVDAFGAVLAKKDSHACDVEPVVVTDIVVLLPIERGIDHEPTTRAPSANHPYLLLPPSRGPPV